MSAEKLKSLVEKGNLINLNISSDSLTTLLNEVAAMLADQQRSVASIRKELADKISREDFASFKDQWRIDRDTLMRNMPSLDNIQERLSYELEKNKSASKAQIEESTNTILMSVDNRIAKKLDSVLADQILLVERVSELENKAKAGPVRRAPSAPHYPSRTDSSATAAPADGGSPGATATPGETAGATGTAAPSGTTAPVATVASGALESMIDESDLVGRIEELEAQFAEFSSGGKIDQSVIDSLKSDIREQFEEFQREMCLMFPDPNAPPPQPATPEPAPVATRPIIQEEQEQEEPPEPEDEVPSEPPKYDRRFDEIQRIVDESMMGDGTELDMLKSAIGALQFGLEECNQTLTGKVERKCEISLVERMFEKLKNIVAAVKEELTVVNGQLQTFVPRKDMEDYVQNCLNSLLNEEQTATAFRALKCLSCGRARLKTANPESHIFRPLDSLSPKHSPKK
jgi:hypothetical protein